MSNGYPRLCGGTFFTLICEASKIGRAATMLKLIDATLVSDYTPAGRIDDAVTRFRDCTSDSLGGLLLKREENVESEVDGLNENITDPESYQELLVSMSEFVESCIDRDPRQKKDRKLVGRLLRLIEEDTSISPEDLFYVSPNGSPIPKSQVLEMQEIHLESFLLGVWHYALMYRQHNDGKETFARWCTEISGNNKGFNKNAFRPSKHEFKWDKRTVSTDDVEDSSKEDNQITTVDVAQEPSLDDNKSEFPGISAGVKELQKAIGALKEEVAEKVDLPAWAEEYFNSCESYYSMVTTSLFPDRPVRFQDVFICSDIAYTDAGKKDHLIQNAKVSDLEEYSFRTVIIGPGGMGKSMMMRNLFLDEIGQRNRIPVLFSLVEYEGNAIIEIIFDQIEAMGIDTSKEEIGELLKSGKLVLFLDAFDEITEKANQVEFSKQINRFLMKYQNTPIIMSCREMESTKTFHQFAQVHLLPFSTGQMIAYVKKAGFSQEQQNEIFNLPIVREIVQRSKDKITNLSKNSLDSLNTRLLVYREALSRELEGKPDESTPLIFSMVLFAYRSNTHIDDKSFYRDVFMTMVHKHDEGKEIPVNRKYETELRPLELEELFAEFCYKGYIKGDYAFTEQEFYDIAKDMGVDSQAFLADLHERASMLVLEKNTLYKFVHRNFQQFYAAWYMCNHSDNIELFYKNLSAHNWIDRDRQIKVMLNISRPAVEEHIFMPYLRSLLSKDYHHFLNSINPAIHIQSYKEKMDAIKMGQTGLQRVVSDLYGHIMDAIGEITVCQLIVGNFELEGLDGRRLLYINKDTGEVTIQRAAEAANKKAGHSVFVYAYDECFVAYRELVKTGNQEILKCLDREKSVLKQQYKKFLNYYEELKAKYPGR